MASILKSTQSVPLASSSTAEVFNYEDVATRARDYLDSVRQQAAIMIDEARRECETLRAQAVQEGHLLAKEAAAQDTTVLASELAADQVAIAMQSIEQLGKSFEEATRQWLRQWQHETIPLAIEIAEKLICRQIETDPDILMQWITQSVRLVQNSRKIQLRMHPRDIALLQPALGTLIKQLSSSTTVEVLEDATIERTGAIIATPDGHIDVQLKTQLRRLSEELQ
jgi:flagellar assembly protein FliH